ncbi:hypothetical protein BDN72DRAFT_849192 [Pluteus cervinus]|uniref:Uncharacterized protein n=1 Tax=Pluteus cervinus TaxID=181527 RepID=A0ACD3A8N2_9AGAR|nr:hypothetical protein BDN72DRAFT_849192 [Pluteus cervinus]
MDSDFLARPLTLEEVDKKINLLEYNLRILRGFHNDFSFVYRLPEEVLTRIFSILQQALEKCRSGMWHLMDGISTDNPGFKEWIIRSQRCLITMKNESITEALLPRVSVALQELPRIQSLTMNIPAPLWGNIMSSFATPAPALRILCITTRKSASNSFLPNLFAGTSSRLQKLILIGCRFNNIPQCLLSRNLNLTDLSIENPPRDLSPGLVLSALMSTPRLLNLTMRKAFSARCTLPLAETKSCRVSLHHLTTLTLDPIDVDKSLYFLSNLSLNNAACLTFRLRRETDATDALSRLLRGNAEVRHPQLEPFHTIHFLSFPSSSLKIWRMSSTGSLCPVVDFMFPGWPDSPLTQPNLRTLDEQTQQAISNVVSLKTSAPIDLWSYIPLIHLKQLSLDT